MVPPPVTLQLTDVSVALPTTAAKDWALRAFKMAAPGETASVT